MIKKLFLMAALPAPSLAYAGNPNANLSTQVVPAESGSGVLPGSILPPCPGGCTWTLAFDDEFNGSSLDTTKWHGAYGDGNVEYGFGAPTLADCFGQNRMPSPGAVSVSGGALTMQTVGTVAIGNPGSYACSIASNRTFGPNAYYEVKQIADPAAWDDTFLWMQPGQNGACWFGPNFVETFGGGGRNGQMQEECGTVYGPLAGNLSTTWHVVGFEWEPYPNYGGSSTNTYTFYLDGIQGLTGNFDNCAAASPCNRPANLWLQAGLYYPANQRNGYKIDWVRVYTHP